MTGLRTPLHGRDHDPKGKDGIRVARFLPIVFDGVGGALITGVKGDVPVHLDPFHRTVKIGGWRLVADQAGDLVIDIWKSDYAGFPPTVANSITAAAQPTLSGSDKAEDTTLTGWTTDIVPGDILRFHIDSASVVTRATLTLFLVTS